MFLKIRNLLRAGRWWMLIVASTMPWLLGYTGTTSLLILNLGPAVGFWFWGFDRARRGKPRLFDGATSRETERVALFVIAVLAAATMVAGSHHQEVARRGEEMLYLAAGFTIKRQGYRVGSKRLEWWEYRDELRYGALGDVVVMLVVAAVIMAAGGTVGAGGLAMVVVPMGMIAVSDEPSYGDEGAHAMRFLIRMQRRRNGVLDEAW
jgi:hypothetical protein